jgi:hypothetical protein
MRLHETIFVLRHRCTRLLSRVGRVGGILLFSIVLRPADADKGAVSYI